MMALRLTGRPADTGRTRFPASVPGTVIALVARGIGGEFQSLLEWLVGLALWRRQPLAQLTPEFGGHRFEHAGDTDLIEKVSELLGATAPVLDQAFGLDGLAFVLLAAGIT